VDVSSGESPRTPGAPTDAEQAPPASLAMPFADRLAHVLAVWFGCGHLPAPGTCGTLGAIPLYLLVRPHGAWAVAGCAAVLTGVGIWAADRVARRLGTKDPQIICIDEVAGVFVTFIAAPRTTMALVVGVVLFRIFDQFKPWPARLAERRLPGGFGVVLDDVAAGLWGATALGLAHRAGLL
jgi:phosphatidylglycerophosphatase A